MNVCALHAVGDLRFEQMEKPIPQKGEVLVHIKACGICGSDVPRVLSKGTYHFPTVPGHEFAGIVEEAGSDDVAQWVGKRVAVFPLLPCFKCESCRVGGYAQCADYDYFGSRRDGGFGEYLAVPTWNLIEIPDGIPYEVAAMTEPASVAYHAISLTNIKPGQTVLVVGSGTIGLMVALWCKTAGASHVVVCDVSEANLKFANQIGLDETINTANENLQDALNKYLGKDTVDISFECAGVSPALETCLNATKAHGEVVTVGNPAGQMAISQNSYWCILRKELLVHGSWNSQYGGKDSDWAKVLNALGQGKIDLAPLITHRFSLEDCNKAFEVITDKNELTIKVMFINE